MRASRIVLFLLYFVIEVLRANVRLARDVLAPHPRFDPALIRLDVGGMQRWEILLLAQLISITPGSLIVDMPRDDTLLVHLMYRGDANALRTRFKGRFLAAVHGITRQEHSV